MMDYIDNMSAQIVLRFGNRGLKTGFKKKKKKKSAELKLRLRVKGIVREVISDL